MRGIFTLNDVTVDVSMVYDIAPDDEAYVYKMVHTFLATMPANIKKVADYFQQQDWENLYKAAHYAKSTLSIIKINDLHAKMQQVETSARLQTALDELAPVIDSITKQYAIAEEILKANFPDTTVATNNL